ncbi:uncharacterized protein CLUP02_10510 [Colletotrichum lupini]|uniref:Uncharacterized protein n=1 Tax=Colletotrichum lupini TaxID=145971 RepID=A0A9Q8WIV1_9PEZI|nr:uncharacterized protein CLUP02_10510 [Colletotrichum lupini]UQC85014.1 hypothetical protein CLUP02_10510 [Colletotrichum lupini]
MFWVGPDVNRRCPVKVVPSVNEARQGLPRGPPVNSSKRPSSTSTERNARREPQQPDQPCDSTKAWFALSIRAATKRNLITTLRSQQDSIIFNRFQPGATLREQAILQRVRSKRILLGLLSHLVTVQWPFLTNEPRPHPRKAFGERKAYATDGAA